MADTAEGIERARNTRAALIDAGIRLFGARGFEATSTRALSEEAGANIASIAYHFGSKEGLHRACGEAVAGRIGAVAMASAARPAPDGDHAGAPVVAEDDLVALMRGLGRFMLESDAAQAMLPFILKEMSDPRGAFDAIYETMLAPMHGHVCRLYGAATGANPDSDETRLTVFGFIGQILYFRIAQAAVTRRLGKAGYEPDDITHILDAAEHTIRARIAAARSATP